MRYYLLLPLLLLCGVCFGFISVLLFAREPYREQVRGAGGDPRRHHHQLWGRTRLARRALPCLLLCSGEGGGRASGSPGAAGSGGGAFRLASLPLRRTCPASFLLGGAAAGGSAESGQRCDTWSRWRRDGRAALGGPWAPSSGTGT